MWARVRGKSLYHVEISDLVVESVWNFVPFLNLPLTFFPWYMIGMCSWVMSVYWNQCSPPTRILSVGERDASGFEPVSENPLIGKLRE